MDYTQPAACLDALRKLHPIDFRATHDTLSRFVRGLLGARPAPNQHLEVLEAARDTLNFAQGEMARSYTTRPLPPSRDAERTLDHVEGLLTSWDVIARPEKPLGALRRVAVATPDEPCHALMSRMLRDRRHLAIVRGAAGETLGLVTLEDLVEEFVGDINDEHDDVASGDR